MAKLYQGAKQENVGGVQYNPTSAPDNALARQAQATKTQLLLSNLDTIVKSGALVVDTADRVIQKKATEQGQMEAATGQESSANDLAWGGSTQRDAYNKVRAEIAVRSMPSFVDSFMRMDKENTKPIDDMSEAELQGAYTRAREAFFKENKIEGSDYAVQATLAATDIQQSHLANLRQRQLSVRQDKAVAGISEMVSLATKDYGGQPEALEAYIDENFNTFATALGGTAEANVAVANGLLQAVTADKPSLEALNYLKSDAARKRFSGFKGFDQVVQQAETYTQKAKNAYRDELNKQAESGFYINLSGGAFKSTDDVKKYLDTTPLDPKTKFNLQNRAAKYLKTREGAVSIQNFIDTDQFNVVNAQKPEVLEEAFSINVGSPDGLDLRNMTLQQENALVNWVKKGFNVPKWIQKFGDSPLNNGDSKSLDDQLNLYSNLKNRLGESSVGTIFSSETQAKLEEWARLRADTTLSPADRKKTLDQFDIASKTDLEGSSLNMTIRRELDPESDKGLQIMSQIESFVSEGGSNVFGGPDDLQPTFTFSDMTAEESAPSMDYGKKLVAGNYATYRRAGLSPEDALSRAQSDFMAKNQWVEWNYGKNKNTYIPKEFGDGFSDKSMQYLEKTKVLDKIALQEGLTVEEVKKAITIQPARDYNSTRKVSVYFNGIEKDVGFTADQYHNEQSLLKKEELAKISREASIRSQSKQWQEQQKQLSTLQSIIKGFGF